MEGPGRTPWRPTVLTTFLSSPPTCLRPPHHPAPTPPPPSRACSAGPVPPGSPGTRRHQRRAPAWAPLPCYWPVGCHPQARCCCQSRRCPAPPWSCAATQRRRGCSTSGQRGARQPAPPPRACSAPCGAGRPEGAAGRPCSSGTTAAAPPAAPPAGEQQARAMGHRELQDRRRHAGIMQPAGSVPTS